jgi:hypothetical protein
LSTEKITIGRGRLETVVSVLDWPHRSLGFLVCSSNKGTGRDAHRLARDESDQWKPTDLAEISKRSGSTVLGRLSGAEKGRILWIHQYSMIPPRWEPVGALLFSVPARKSKPIVILRICLRQSLSDRDKTAATAWLLRCVRNVAKVSGKAGGKLQWNADPGDVGYICRVHGFKRRGNQRQLAVLVLDPD